jgi:hypothetical protein
MAKLRRFKWRLVTRLLALPLSGPGRRPEPVVPVLPLPFRQVVDDAQVGAAGLPDRRLDLGGELAAVGIVVGGNEDRGPLPHPRGGGADEVRLAGVHGTGDAGIARVIVRVQGGMGQGVDAGLGDHQGRVPCPGRREPQGLFAALGEAGEVAVLDLVAAGAVLVGMGKNDVHPPVDLDAAGKARALKQDAGDMALLLEIAVPGQGFHARELAEDLRPVSGDGLDLAPEEVRMRPGEGLPSPGPGPQLLAHAPELTALAVLNEIDNGAVIAVLVHGKVNPMPVLAARNDDLIAFGLAHDHGIARAGPAIEEVPLVGRVLGQIDIGFEVFQLGVHVLPRSPPLRS